LYFYNSNESAKESAPKTHDAKRAIAGHGQQGQGLENGHEIEVHEEGGELQILMSAFHLNNLYYCIKITASPKCQAKAIDKCECAWGWPKQ
jgi:hypothetical protein